MKKVWSSESERIVNLTDIDENISDDELFDIQGKLFDELCTEEEMVVMEELAFEGVPLDDEELENCKDEECEEMTVREYILDLKSWARNCLDN